MTVALARPDPLVAAQGKLKPGEFRWSPGRAPSGPIVVIVSIPDQLTFVYRNGVRIGAATCSTGKPGHSTPTGVFTVLQKRVEHYSSIYNNAPMPFMQRLTWRGIALHAGDLPGYPASAGCVRLPMRFAKKLFATTDMGTPVIVADRRSAPVEISSPGILLPDVARDQADKVVTSERSREKTPSWKASVVEDVRSIVVSGADKKAIVILNGQVEREGAVRIRDQGKPLGTQAFALLGASPDGRSLEWMSYGIGGAASEGSIVNRRTSDVLSRIEMIDRDEALRVAMTYRPGTTLVVTDNPASPETRSGPDFVVVEGEPYKMPRDQLPKNER